MRPFAFALAALVLVALAVRAEEEQAPPSGAAVVAAKVPVVEIPASLQEFLDEKADDGKPVVGEEERKYLLGLPEHTRKLLGEAGENSLGGPKHLQALLSLKLSPQGFETVLQDKCILCHTDVDNQKPELLFSVDPGPAGSNKLLNLKELVADVHFRRGLSCAGCHGGDPAAELMGTDIAKRWPARDERHKDRTWIPEFCARCHADPTFMRGFNPGMPTDQLAKYKESMHGVLLLEKKDSNAAQCVSCHGVHGIRGPKSRQSTVFPTRVAETCGACHANAEHMAGYKNAKGEPLPTDQLEKYKRSVHGRALLEKGELNAATCNDCHGNHAAMPPAVANLSQVCRTCHMLNGQLFDGSKHKEAFAKNGWPECEQCHGKHDIQTPTDDLMVMKAGGLCFDCHEKNAKDHPKCNETAKYFHDSLQELKAGVEELNGVSEHLAEKGLDVEPLGVKATELREASVQARTRIHSFDKGSFDSVAAPGRQALDDGRKLVAAADDEFLFRRKGLLSAIGFMALLAAGIYLKVRQMEERK